MVEHGEERHCRGCLTPSPANARFCGRCGASLPAERVPVSVGVQGAPGHERRQATGGTGAGAETQVTGRSVPTEPTADPFTAGLGQLGRRSLFAGADGRLVGGVAGVTLSRWREPRVTYAGDGLPIAEFEIGRARQVAHRIAAEGPLVLPEEEGRIAIVRWDPSYSALPTETVEEDAAGPASPRPTPSGPAWERYGPPGEDQPVVDGSTGLMALSLVSTHLPCRVRFCASSSWFEDPCHGSRWNGWGEWTGGPAPWGLDRIAARIRDDGMLVLDLTRHIAGTPRENNVLEQSPTGPSCVDV